MLIIFAIFYRLGPQRFENSSKDLFMLLLLFIFFAVGIDMLHSFTLENLRFSHILALFEDGGEMIALSLMVWYFAFIIGNGDRNRPYLYRLFYKNRK